MKLKSYVTTYVDLICKYKNLVKIQLFCNALNTEIWSVVPLKLMIIEIDQLAVTILCSSVMS